MDCDNQLLKKGEMKVEFLREGCSQYSEKLSWILSKKGYYDGTELSPRNSKLSWFQGGCPRWKRVAGGPGYSINCELDGDNQYHDRGVLSMAHAGRNTGGSQFFHLPQSPEYGSPRSSSYRFCKGCRRT